MANCPACKATVAEGDRFCGECGANLLLQEPATHAPSAPECPSCGAAYGAADQFCSKCGHDLRRSASAARGAPPAGENTRPDASEGPPSLWLLLIAVAIGALASQVPVWIDLTTYDRWNWFSGGDLLLGLASGIAGCLLAVGLAYGASRVLHRRLSWRQSYYGAIAVFVVILLVILSLEPGNQLGMRAILAGAAGLAIGYEALTRYKVLRPVDTK